MSRAIRRSLPFLAALGCALALIGCGCSSEPKFVYDGTWRGNRKLDLPDTTPDVATSAGAVELIINYDRFQLSEAGVPTKGEVRKEGNHAVLHITEVFERPISATGANAEAKFPDIKVTPQEDGSILFDNPVAYDAKPLGLNKIKD